MPWTLIKSADYQATVQLLESSEQNKVNDWTNLVTGQNMDPLRAAGFLGYRIGPGPGTYMEFYAGSYHRVFFTYDGTARELRLEHVGHVR